MNYSKSMKVNVKRFFTSWIISLIITAVISSSVTALLVKPDPVETVHHHELTKVYFFNPKVQVPEVYDKEVQDIEPLLYSLGEYIITAYCSCEICCGEWAKNRPDGIVYGAAMVELQPGISIAAPKDFDFGTQIIIDGVEYVVQDRLANWVVEKYEGKVIDIYFDDHQEALEFGKQVKEIFIIREERKVVQND